MCRKNFDPARLKKLHVDRPDGEEDPREGDLLQRVAMSFEVSEEHRRELLDEIDKWLEEKHEDAAQPLRKARVAIEKYHKLREMGIEDKREITVLKEEKREKALAAEAEKERTAAIETSLLERTKELQAQIVAAQGEIDHLRNEMQRRTQLKNPLPHPPQPTNFNIYSNFDSSTGPNAWYNDDGRSMLLPSRASVSIPNGVSYVHPRNLYPEDDRENRTHVLHESNGVKRDRKGKGRDIPEPAYDNRRSVYGPPHTALEAPKPKPGIIPGASPKSKFMPPDPETEVRERGFNAFKPPDPVPPYMNGRADLPHKGYDPARDSVDTYSLTASMLTELQNGLNEGFNRGFQAIQRAIPSGMPSGSRARDSDPEAGARPSPTTIATRCSSTTKRGDPAPRSANSQSAITTASGGTRPFCGSYANTELQAQHKHYRLLGDRGLVISGVRKQLQLAQPQNPTKTAYYSLECPALSQSEQANPASGSSTSRKH
ncbi:hypothetical protein EST38_g9236 [Candolleomyces aberdarensis]|uniref:Uncharacterized protein n=1 Tax=Candolleomyces aberdarensis TaxID=2316362 RepID=A0A4Q2DDN8_9AGAR|nr:hypothetical protein EST38_g9236 [Candolleomyces aberdarensis]